MGMSFTKGVDIGSTELAVGNTKHHNLIDLAVANEDGDRTNVSQLTSLIHIASTAPNSNPSNSLDGNKCRRFCNGHTFSRGGRVWVFFPVVDYSTSCNNWGKYGEFISRDEWS